MDPEQAFLRVHERFSVVLARLLTPRFRALLEYLCLFNALMLLALLVVMHVNFVAQPGCSKEFSGLAIGGAQLVQVKITGSRNQITDDSLISQVKQVDIAKDSGVWEFSEDTRLLVSLEENSEENFTPEISARPLAGAGRGVLGTTLLHYLARWSNEAALCAKSIEQTLRSFWQVWRITGWEPFTTSPKGDRRSVAWSRLDSVLVDLPDKGKVLDPTYMYSLEKGYLMLSDGAKSQHGVRTVNVTISAQNSCFGNRWQQLLIDNFVGYDTILMNSLLHACGKGYLYNFQTKELYNLNYLQEFGGVPHGFEDYIVFKCGVLITSLFVFFTTTMSVSFTLRETQARMLKFTVQLQHHARHRLPTYRLIFVHVVESLVFVPIMIGILFFLFEFFDDQLLAFMVLTLVWLCELYSMISVRTPLSMQYFPCFFFLYFMVFHVYFFSYTYGFSYLAFSATGAFMQHLVLYFWNQFEVPALQNFLHRRALFQQQRLQISSAIFRVAGLRSSSLLGDTQGTALNSMSERGGSFLNMHAEIGGQYGNEPERTALERNGTSDHRDLQASAHPFSITNFSSFPVDGSADVYNAGIGNQNTEIRSLGQSPQGRQHDELERSVGLGGLSEDNENVSERDRIGTIPSIIFQSSGSEAQISAGEGTQAGPFTLIRSLLPWMLGSGHGSVVSFLPIFQGSRNHRQLDMVLRRGRENNERGFASGANSQTEQESNERVLVRGVYSPARLRR